MIKFNDNNINDFNLGGDNIIKVYHQGNVVYQKLTVAEEKPYIELEYVETPSTSPYARNRASCSTFLNSNTNVL